MASVIFDIGLKSGRYSLQYGYGKNNYDMILMDLQCQYERF